LETFTGVIVAMRLSDQGELRIGEIVAMSRAIIVSWNRRGYGEGVDDDRAVFCMIAGLHA
jgi:hypothetical protein